MFIFALCFHSALVLLFHLSVGRGHIACESDYSKYCRNYDKYHENGVGQSPIISERAYLGAEADYDEHNKIEHEGCDLAVYLGCAGLDAAGYHYSSADNHDRLFGEEHEEYPAESDHQLIVAAAESYVEHNCDSYLSQLICNGIEYLAELADLIEAAGDFSVKEIADAGKREHEHCPADMTFIIEHGECGYKKDSYKREQIRDSQTALKQIFTIVILLKYVPPCAGTEISNRYQPRKYIG